MKCLLLLALLLLPAAPSSAAQWRLRARENYETGQTDLGDGAGELGYRGFRTAANVFYEQPFHYMAGLAVQRGRMGRAVGDDSLTTTTVGLEGKLFPAEALTWWFIRSGVLAEALDPAGPGKDMWVYGGSLGTGLEFPVWKLGIAPEVGGKMLWGSRGRNVRNLYVALGVHFYVFPGDLPKQ